MMSLVDQEKKSSQVHRIPFKSKFHCQGEKVTTGADPNDKGYSQRCYEASEAGKEKRRW